METPLKNSEENEKKNLLSILFGTLGLNINRQLFWQIVLSNCVENYSRGGFKALVSICFKSFVIIHTKCSAVYSATEIENQKAFCSKLNYFKTRSYLFF